MAREGRDLRGPAKARSPWWTACSMSPWRAATTPRLLDAMPYPENLAHHFVVDPTKFDFYAMDCYRHLAEDKLAENLAGEVIRSSIDFDGSERAPMRTAEARITSRTNPRIKRRAQSGLRRSESVRRIDGTGST
jgi:hypothetical protein